MMTPLLLKKDDPTSPYVSPIEAYFHWWLLDLEQQGCISNIMLNNIYTLRAPLELEVLHKNKKVQKNLFPALTYNLDVSFTVTAKGKLLAIFSSMQHYTPRPKFPTLYYNDDDGVYVEVKSKHYKSTYEASARTFPIKARLLFESENIFVTKLTMGTSKHNHYELFNATFYPNRYRYTDSANALRKLDANLPTVHTYIQSTT
jgi:hypothetical protein